MTRGLLPLVLLVTMGQSVGQSELAFPQIVVGESFETVVQVSNNVAVNDSVTFEVFSGESADLANGAPLAVQVDGAVPSATFVRQLSPFQDLSLRLSLADSGLRAGWLRIRSNTPGGKVSASLFYRIRQGTKVLDSVGVTSAERFRFAQIQFDDREEAASTGVAFINPDDTPVDIAIDLYRGEERLETLTLQLAPHQHFARLASELFPQQSADLATMVIETSASRSIPILTLRLDGTQLTSMPVRPFGFSLQYEIRDESEALLETGYWVFDSNEFKLIGSGTRTDLAPNESFTVVGTWFGNSFQCFHRQALEDGSFGTVVFNGTSEGVEKTAGAPIVGRVTHLDGAGNVLSVNQFSAFSKF